MANGCRTFLRVILGIITALFLVIGLFMLGFGIALKVDPTGLFKAIIQIDSEANLKYALGSITDGAGIFMIVLGCITIVISLLGFAGAISGSPALLIIYAIIMFLFLGAEIALIVVVAAFPQQLAGKIVPITDFSKEDVILASGKKVLPPTDVNGFAWFVVQNYFDCCGFSNSSDYFSGVSSRKLNISRNSIYYINSNSFNLSIPVSCCTKNVPNWTFNSTDDLVDFDGCTNSTPVNYNIQGCATKVIASNAAIPIAIAAVTLGLELILIVCSVAIATMGKKHSTL